MPYGQNTHDVFMGEATNIHAIYEVAPINDVARITVHRQRMMMHKNKDVNMNGMFLILFDFM